MLIKKQRVWHRFCIVMLELTESFLNQSLWRWGMNCWEYKHCGREKGGVHAESKGVCPAYPYHGQHCARVAGTLCGGKVQGEFAPKLLSCLRCDFYQSLHYDRSYGKGLSMPYSGAETAQSSSVACKRICLFLGSIPANTPCTS
jgi:hypothetical protein